MVGDPTIGELQAVVRGQVIRLVVEGVTEVMVTVEGEGMRGVTWVLVDEVRSGQWGIGGRVLAANDVKALSAESPA